MDDGLGRRSTSIISHLLFCICWLGTFITCNPAEFSLGELEPYCQDPFKFKSSLTPFDGFTPFKTAYLEGVWYEVVRNKELFILEECTCGIATFGSAPVNLENQLLTFACNKKQSLWKRNVMVTVVNPTQTWLKLDLGIDILHLYVLAFDESNYSWVLFGDTCRRGFILYSIAPNSMTSEMWISKVQPVLRQKGYKIQPSDFVWTRNLQSVTTSVTQCAPKLPDQEKTLQTTEGKEARNGEWTEEEISVIVNARKRERTKQP